MLFVIFLTSARLKSLQCFPRVFWSKTEKNIQGYSWCMETVILSESSQGHNSAEILVRQYGAVG